MLQVYDVSLMWIPASNNHSSGLWTGEAVPADQTQEDAWSYRAWGRRLAGRRLHFDCAFLVKYYNEEIGLAPIKFNEDLNKRILHTI